MLKLLTAVTALLCLTCGTQGWVVYPCRTIPLGMQSGLIKNSQIKASSILGPNHAAWRARLHLKKQGVFAGGWSAKVNNNKQWLQVDMGELTMFTGIKTQGRQDADQWVKSYDIWFSDDGHYFQPYKGGLKFKANTNRNGVVHHVFPKPYIVARYIRVKPLTWHNRISMRIELMGCPQSTGIKLLCTRTHMTIHIRKYLLNGLSPHEVHLNDPKCRAKQITVGGAKYYQLRTTLNGCGTTCTATHTNINYANLVSQSHMRPGQVAWRLQRVALPFTCSYRSYKLETSRGMDPNDTILQLSEHGVGMFPCALDIYKSVRYVHKYNSKLPTPIKVNLRERIYMQLMFSTGDKHLYLRADMCWATPNKFPHSLPLYWMIKHGCAMDPTLNFYKRKSYQVQRFSFLSFMLLKHHKYVYIHCKIRICKGHTGFCAKSCAVGKRGMSSEDLAGDNDKFTHLITHGPIQVEDIPNVEAPAQKTVAEEQDESPKEGVKASLTYVPEPRHEADEMTEM